jgi:hypothetical protein
MYWMPERVSGWLYSSSTFGVTYDKNYIHCFLTVTIRKILHDVKYQKIEEHISAFLVRLVPKHNETRCAWKLNVLFTTIYASSKCLLFYLCDP